MLSLTSESATLDFSAILTSIESSRSVEEWEDFLARCFTSPAMAAACLAQMAGAAVEETADITDDWKSAAQTLKSQPAPDISAATVSERR